MPQARRRFEIGKVSDLLLAKEADLSGVAMSTRRPRILVKPNLGRKTDGAAAPPARKPAPAPAPAPPAEAPPPPEPSVAEQPAPAPAPAPTEERPEPATEPPAAPEPPAAETEPPPPVVKAPKRPSPASSAPHSPIKVARVSSSEASKEAPPPPPREPTPPPREAPPPQEESPAAPVRSASPEHRPRKPEKKARRARSKVLRKIPTDRSAMTMQDLIYYNPPGNPMQEKASKGSHQKDGTEDGGSTQAEEEAVEDVVPVAEQEEEQEQEEELEQEEAGPRVRLGPNGEITLDEESLVIRRPTTRTAARVVYETGGETSYKSFRRQPMRRKIWTAPQTARFYRALSVCGTDFTLMATFFPSRTRQELKNKFKREERQNRELVDKTITDPTQFDLEGLEEEEPDEPEKPEKPPRRRRGGGRGSRSSRRSRKTPRSSAGSQVAEEEEEVVEEEVVQDEITLEDEGEDSGETASPTPPPPLAHPPVLQQQQQGGQAPPLRLQAGQLVFYASRTEEQVVHVFVVAPPQQAVTGSELVSRLSAPPLQGPFQPQPSAAAS